MTILYTHTEIEEKEKEKKWVQLETHISRQRRILHAFRVSYLFMNEASKSQMSQIQLFTALLCDKGLKGNLQNVFLYMLQ